MSALVKVVGIVLLFCAFELIGGWLGIWEVSSDTVFHGVALYALLRTYDNKAQS